MSTFSLDGKYGELTLALTKELIEPGLSGSLRRRIVLPGRRGPHGLR